MSKELNEDWKVTEIRTLTERSVSQEAELVILHRESERMDCFTEAR